MLRLERMQMSGFKSFSEPTDVTFRAGITAVVGPNGCGKSNLGDAINWVLGEQSPKLLRGRQMADVIFNGSERRKPVGMAEVTLVFTGAEGLVAPEEGELRITRRLFRTGESEYLLNGRKARLKDIQDVLDRARVGARSYATIEQGRIDQILNAKPKDRRLLIEDAAGISGYKHKRRLTELKLEATHANLLRVNDIVLEVERQVRSLKRQAARARRYRRLRDELRAKERLRFALRTEGADADLAARRRTEAGCRDAEAGEASRLARIEAEVTERRTGLDRATEGFRAQSERMHQLELSIDREEAQVRAWKERIEESLEAARRFDGEAADLVRRSTEARASLDERRSALDRGRDELERTARELEAAQHELAAAETEYGSGQEGIEGLRREQFAAVNRAVELRNRQRAAEEALERTGARRAPLLAERDEASEDSSRHAGQAVALSKEHDGHRESLEELSSRVRSLEGRQVELRRRHAEEVAALAEVREQRKSAVARLATLEDVATRFAGVSDGVRAVLGEGRTAGVRAIGVVADYVEAGADVERAAERYLDWFLPAVIVEDDSDVHRATELLRAAGAGRISMLSRAQPVGALAVGAVPNGQAERLEAVLRDPRVHGRLRERLSLRGAANGVVQDRFGDAVLVDDLAAALELHRHYPGTDYVTREGDVVFASGVISAGGDPAADNGLLAHKRRTADARAEVERASAGEAVRLAESEVTGEELAAVERELGAARERIREAGQRAVELEMQLRRSREEAQRTERRRTVLEDELAALDEERAQLERSLGELREAAAEAGRAEREVEASIARRAEAIAEVRGRVKQLGERLGAKLAEHAARRERQEAAEEEGRRLTQALGDLDQRAERVRAEALAARTRAEEGEVRRSADEAALVQHLAERESLAAAVAAMEREIGELQRATSEGEAESRKAREALERLRQATREAEIERLRVESARQHLDELCRHELGCTAGEALAAAGEELATASLEELEQQTANLREEIERIGPVNMTAIEEFTELEERHAFLSAQRADLEQAMTSLKETIRRINRSSRERFVATFEAIRANYQEIFRLLFNGGRADLQLEEGEDVLECGIEIMVQPPGKRLGSIQLMSGGEKALSAIALLFAIFRHQPSPFCLLDEVDAPLDDANVGRFTRMVRQYAENTQFVLITHNKLSMESADLLYGVTMNEPGVSRVMSIQFQ